jgi:hypothetical protein
MKSLPFNFDSVVGSMKRSDRRTKMSEQRDLHHQSRNLSGQFTRGIANIRRAKTQIDVSTLNTIFSSQAKASLA